MTELPYPVFDADNHYYEALDAFTRYVEPAMQPRCVQWCKINGRKYHLVGGRLSRAVVNPTFDPVAKAGAMHDYFRGNPNKLQPYEFLRDREPIPAEYRDRDARIAKLDGQPALTAAAPPRLASRSRNAICTSNPSERMRRSK